MILHSTLIEVSFYAWVFFSVGFLLITYSKMVLLAIFEILGRPLPQF